jgi:DNA-binding CsgD family transcriptional regulator
VVLGFPRVKADKQTDPDGCELAGVLDSAEPLSGLAAPDMYRLLGPPLLSVVAGIRVLKERATNDAEMVGELAAVEAAVAGILARLGAHDLPMPATRPDLSRREVQVLGQVAAGLSNKEIARQLGISRATVRNHLSHACNKLRATNRTSAAINALRSGFLTR